MTTFLFWNLNKKPLQSLIANLIEQYEIDVLIFAECSISPTVLLQSLNHSERKYSYSPNDSCKKIEIYTRFSPEFSKPVLDGTEFTIRHLTFPGNVDILLTAVHFPSKLYWNDASQAFACVELSDEIKATEEKIGHTRTILVGDLNMNPFENRMLSANGLHAVMSKMTAKKQSRVVKGKITTDGRPHSRAASDHLPLLFSLDLDIDKEGTK